MTTAAELWNHHGPEIPNNKTAGELLSHTADRIYTLVNVTVPRIDQRIYDLERAVNHMSAPVAVDIAAALAQNETFISAIVAGLSGHVGLIPTAAEVAKATAEELRTRLGE